MTTELTLLPHVSCRGREITAPRLRGLLALLAQELRTGCSTGRLVEGLWPDDLPERPGKAAQVLVSRLRAQLGAELIVSTPTGYRLALDEAQVDSSALLRYETGSAERARAGDHPGALAQAETGLALWDGVLGAGSGEDLRDPLVALRADRVRVLRSLARTRALALARVGRREEAVAPLAGLARELPRDEEVLAELLRCEAATSGRAAALTRYDAYRRALREELGTGPGPGLRALHQELLGADVPPARHGVPHEPNALLGRDADLAAVTGLLREVRVVTLVGPGGLGKTRLSHAVSRAAEQPVVHFVPLAGVTADEGVADEVASAVGAAEGRPFTAGPDVVGGIVAALGPGPALLVLDNCEQVVRGVAGLVQALVSRAKELRILTTSRAPLGLTSESLYALPELSPAVSAALFEQRARAARPGVELPADQVAEICRHLDGLPLAVELAAARVRVLSVGDISHRLRDRFALLRGGARDAPERHRTLRAVVEWSWNLLEPDGRAALRALSVFPGGFAEDAAEHLLGDRGDTLALLEQLADQSLIKVGEGPSGVRFHMLETLREFSAARRAEAGEEEPVTERFLSWARDFGRAHHDVLFSGDPLSSIVRIRAEQDNFVLALRYALARDDGPTVAALTAVLASLWATDTHYARLAALAAETGGPLSHFRPGPEDVEAVRSAAAVCTAGLFMGRGPHAVRQLVTLRRLPSAPPDTLLRGLAVVLCAVPETQPPRYTRLRELCDADQPMVAGVAACLASYVWESEHRTEQALECARRALDVLGPLGNPSMMLLVHGRISELCLQSERGAEAYRHLRAARDALEESGEWSDSIGVHWGLVFACLQRGEVDEAEYWLGLTALDRQPEYSRLFAPDLPARAEIALARGLTETGLGLWRRAVEQMREDSLPHAGDPFLDPWLLQLQAAALTAHAQHGRLEPVAGLAGQLRERLLGSERGPSGERAPAELPVYGTALLALGFAGLAGGDTAAVRLMALAERMQVLRDFPTLSSARCREAAEKADRAAYTDARSAYAALGREELWAAALRELNAGAHG
ncbi:ATP-binding protein [Streptomyces nodosus]|uniref:AfsR/SARP family transcriptional regulator n=1 Tax=Streptomyces nodosus TaxID=40318 RepID=A0A0B5DDH9_9ACTN|nr:BTAD domain-containing putative transcriptional regulator [Streptomyces nodosus]AJE41648.1 LuxR family transcriptional regulator [Streptomyces nodosus]MBB4792859.1 putative ATPase/tetratricopeptide (TPR) repeat protein [Streptomyces nodosus]QEV40183.1 AfsR/SARP family transcriptional regulator [Streptomyces nodosus]